MSYKTVVDNLVERNILKTNRIIAAFRGVDRADFIPEGRRGSAGIDAPVSIGAGQTISQPLTVALMLEWLQPDAGEQIMDVGAGSGWVSALLAEIVGEEGCVYAIERIDDLCALGKKHLSSRGLIEGGTVKWYCQDAAMGLPDVAEEIGGFDVIHAGAAAKRTEGDILNAVPQAWKDQLKTGGRVVMPIGRSVWKLTKDKEGWEREEHPGFAFVPLVTDQK